MDSVSETLEGYVAGRVKAERVVEAVAAAYYGEERGIGSRERLQPVMDVIERAHPGIVELTGSAEKPGFAVRLTNRPFPKEYEPALRAAVEAVLVEAQHAAPLRAPNPGLVARLFGAIRRLFTASA
jgi:hypothetical protein